MNTIIPRVIHFLKTFFVLVIPMGTCYFLGLLFSSFIFNYHKINYLIAFVFPTFFGIIFFKKSHLQSLLKKIAYIVFLVLFFLIISGNLSDPILKASFVLLFGWIEFLQKKISVIRFDFIGIASFLSFFFVSLVLLQHSLKFLKLNKDDSSSIKTSIQLMCLILFLFASGMATTGITHQVGWLMKQGPFIEENNFFRNWDTDSFDFGSKINTKNELMDAAEAIKNDPLSPNFTFLPTYEKVYFLKFSLKGDPYFLLFPRDPGLQEITGFAVIKPQEVKIEPISNLHLWLHSQ